MMFFWEFVLIIKLSDLIAQKMEEREVDKSAMARKIGISRSHFYKLLNAELEDIKVSTLIKISLALEEHPVALLRTFLLSNQHYKKAVNLPVRHTGDAVGFVGTIDDREIVQADSRLFQTWILQNIGSRTWEGRSLICVDDEIDVQVKNKDMEVLTSQPTLLPDNHEILIPLTPVGGKIELTAHFTAPKMPGTFYSFWKMVDQDGSFCFPKHNGLFCRVMVRGV